MRYNITCTKSIRKEKIKKLDGYDGDGMLTAEREMDLIAKWQILKDEKALSELVMAFHPYMMAYVQKMSLYGISADDLYSEAIVGLMQALEKFEIHRGNRFATYLRWKVKASVGQHVLDNWSLVKIGSSNAHKKLFFSVRTLHDKISKSAANISHESMCEQIAKHLDVTPADVDYVLARMSNPVTSVDIPDSDYSATEDSILDEARGIDRVLDSDLVVARMSKDFVVSRLKEALCILDEREYLIITNRIFCDSENERTLEDIGRELGITRERVRQIQEGALLKMREYLREEGQGTFDSIDEDLILATKAA